MSPYLITYLKLHRCSRFRLTGFETIEISPTAKTQMVLGTNGSGKSSLLRIGFTVMPATSNDFKAGGYKEIHVLKEGRRYVLKNNFEGKSPEHRFEMDDEDLNPSRTLAVQKELIREHFGMTQEIHDVISGLRRFTAMSPKIREEWITTFSSASFDFILNMRSDLKKLVRNSGIIADDHASRLAVETGKLMSEAEVVALKERYRETKDELDILFQETRTDVTPLTGDELLYLKQALENEVATLLRYDLTPPAIVGTSDLGEIQAGLRLLNTKEASLMAAIQSLSESQQSVERQLRTMAEIGEIDVKEVTLKVEAYNRQHHQLVQALTTGLTPDQLRSSLHTAEAVKKIMALLHHINPEDQKTYDHQVCKDTQNNLSTLQETLSKGTSRLSEIEYRLSSIERCTDIQCPSCQHLFKPGVDKDERTDLQGQLDKGNSFREKYTTRVNEVRSWLKQAQEYHGTIKEVRTILDNDRSLVWYNQLLNERGGIGKGRLLLSISHDYLADLEHVRYIDIVEYDRAPYIEMLDKVKRVEQSSDASLSQVYDDLTSRIEALHKETVVIQKSLKETKSFHDLLCDYTGRMEQVKEDYNTYRSSLDQYIETIRQEEVASTIGQHQLSLSNLAVSISEADVQHGLVASLTKSLNTAKEDGIAYKYLERAVVAVLNEQVGVFINTFVDTLNARIGRVWGYNLALRHVDLSAGKLDYKFPLYVHAEENGVSDISEGSESQVDIVDWAFVVSMYGFLGLQGHPLYLDELGSSFDDVHRHNLIPAIKELIDDEAYSQVFIISHYIDGQNSYPNSEIVVMNNEHLDLKRKYNAHVRIS